MKNRNNINIKHYSFPCGDMILGSFDGKLCLCDWIDGKKRHAIDFRLQKYLNAEYVELDTEVIEQAKLQLDEYLKSERCKFDIPILFVGTDFQKLVWNELLNIQYGTTISYGELAQRIGCSDSVRAVANANAVNAMSIIVPCHRVVGYDGGLAGYGGGVKKKRFLLNLEENHYLCKK